MALECARNEKSLRRLAIALLFGCYMEGLACLYQYITGFDFIHGYPLLDGRLTGTMATYWVGNYLLLASVPAWALCRYVRHNLGKGFGLFCLGAIAWPIIFGIYFAAARAAYVSGLVVLSFVFFWKERVPRKKILIFLAIVVLVLMAGLCFFGKNRFALQTILTDARLILWTFSIEVFKTSIWTGVGAWQYSSVLPTLEIAQHWSEGWITTSHPHNAYLQVLCETGILGFLMCFGVFFFLFYKAIQGVRAGLLSEKSKPRTNSFWHLTFYFTLGCLAFFVHFLFGHDFFRPWYQALFMIFLGILLGAVVSNKALVTKSEM
ncbi:O-antigen ligase family protein [Desulfovibrio falkowii]|uniref:O-antigen ligase family protein n=1 Tax=Desulfovibrio falkowii TaxID=3136602 RepID=UPI0038B25807